MGATTMDKRVMRKLVRSRDAGEIAPWKSWAGGARRRDGSDVVLFADSRGWRVRVDGEILMSVVSEGYIDNRAAADAWLAALTEE